ncbi:MAG TPA: amino acid adenylation domain-containing protein, partial [Polyangiaceae bacterium]
GSGRLYRTGDRARFREDGNLDYAGRADHQVKIRGVRVELGEVEVALARVPGVEACLVVVREDVPGDRRLVGYVVPSPGAALGAAVLRDALRATLPEAMVPAAYVVLAAMPLTPSGKINRLALPAPEDAGIEDAPFVEPRTPEEEAVAALWREVLGIERAGVGSHFFELGGHSLLATQVVSRVRARLGVELPLRVLFEAPTVEKFAARVALARGAGEEGQDARVTPRSRTEDERLPLSFAQQRLWFLDQLEPGSAGYNMPAAMRVEGPLDVESLRRAFEEIVRRHESLRTTFASRDGEPAQVVHAPAAWPLPVHDLSGLPPEAREAEARRRAAEEAARPFSLERGPLLRTTLLRLAPDEHVLLLVMHHVASDGWSLGVLVKELEALYEAFHGGRSSPLPPLLVQYADFALWQRAYLRGERLEGDLAYWKSALGGVPVLALPTDRPRPPVQSYRGEVHTFALSSALTRALRQLAREHDATLFMVFMAAFQALLHRHSGQDDVCVGTPVANRTRHEVEPLIGMFVNTLVLRGDLADDPRFVDLLADTRERCLAAYAHQDLPLERIIDELAIPRDLSRNPLFQVMLTLQNAPMAPASLSGLSMRPLPMELRTAKLDLDVTLHEVDGGCAGSVEYSTDLFDRSTIERLIVHFERTLAAVVAQPSEKVSRLPILTDEERRLLTLGWNDTTAAFPLDRPMHRLFEDQVVRHPEAIAVRCGDDALTYATLNARANRMARRLVARGVTRDQPVAILLERSVDFLASILAIFKAGGAYVPLDPGYPPERLRQILDQSRARLLITDATLAASIPETGTERLAVDDLKREGDGSNLDTPDDPASLAYVIFTSGSTGLPKGAMLEHRGMINHLFGNATALGLTGSDVIAQNASACFDISVWQFLVALVLGGRTEILTDDVVHEPSRMLAAVQERGVTMLEIVPSFMRMILDDVSREGRDPSALSRLRWLMPTGEALPPELCREWLAAFPVIPLVNAYGPTECSDDVTLDFIKAPPAATVANMPIGRPIANMQVYVLDARGELAPIGVPGEMYIGGIGVGRGYLHDPKRTAEAFVAHPLAREGGLLYRTGDLARWLPGGTLEYLGRVDHQVKIRGFRIELGEIEAVLLAHEAVASCVVVARSDRPGGDRLVAYVVGEQGAEVSAQDLRRHVAERLPDYMVPSAVVRLDALPLTPNGKVDRKALPAPSFERDAREHVAPATPEEEAIAAIWREVLGLETLGMKDSFFELGGHSLLATQVISRMRLRFEMDLPLRYMFEFSTVAALAEQVAALLWVGQRPSAADHEDLEIEDGAL